MQSTLTRPTNERREKARRVTPRTKEMVLREIAAEFPAHIFTPEEAAAISLGRLENVRRAIENARLRLVMERSHLYFLTAPPPKSDDGPARPRPVAALSQLNRAKVFPPLVSPATRTYHVSVIDLIDIIHHRRQTGEPPHRLLDLLVCSSGLSWMTCAELLLHEKVIARALDPVDVEATRQARFFWTLYGEGRARHAALIELKKVPLCPGDWAHFNHRQLEALLPGIVLPDHCRRRQYLSNYLTKGEATVDLYNVDGQPIVRHPFLPKFNPLTFGKPRQLIAGNHHLSE
jgi:hypothetical protein